MPAQVRGNRASVVLVTMDTTRADRIGAYGYVDAVTPTVDGFASEGLRFERAYSVVPLTTPSHATMLSGLYPTRHGIHNNGDAILKEEIRTVAEALSDEGYHTAASISAFVTTRVWNLDQGFDTYFDDVGTEKDRMDRGRWARERSADAVVDDAIGWLNDQPEGEPVFLWLHFYDAHDPYAPPKEWAEKMPDRPYDGEIAFVDSEIARLKGVVDKRQGDAGTAWVIIADHGEALEREHGEHTHGMFLFDPTMRIPFILRPPKPLATGLVESVQTVSNVDVTPSILGMLDLPQIEDVDGVDLSVLMDQPAGTVDRAPVYMEAEAANNRFGFAPERAIAHGPLKLMDTPNPRLFDVVADPGETANLVESRSEDVVRLQKTTKEIISRRIQVATGATSPEVMEQLAALGYMTSEAGIGDSETAKLDAKDQRPLIMKLERARHLSKAKPKKAVALYEEVLTEHPQIAEARLGLSRVYSRMRQVEKAEATLKTALELQPSSTIIQSALAQVVASQKRFDEAETLLRAVLEQVPGDDTARNALVRLYIDQNQLDTALKRVSEWHAEDKKNLGYVAYMGVILTRMNRPGEALPYLEASLADDMPRQQVHSSLALLDRARGNNEGALAHLSAESAWFPDDMNVRMLVGQMLNQLKRWEDAAAEFKYIIERRPKMVPARLACAQATFNAGDYPGAEAILAPALEQAPKNADVQLLQANILQKLGRDDEAVSVYELAKSLHEERMALQEEMRKEQAAVIGDGDFPMPDAAEVTDYLQEYTIPE